VVMRTELYCAFAHYEMHGMQHWLTSLLSCPCRPRINLDPILVHTGYQMLAKLDCLLHYFDRVTTDSVSL
jgi:hypothetical protein